MKTFLENRHLKNYNTCVRHTKRDKWIYIEQASHNRVFLELIIVTSKQTSFRNPFLEFIPNS